MQNSRVFEFVAGELQRATRLGMPAARAAVRNVLDRALFDPETVSAGQMQLLIERLLPSEIRRIGINDAERICREIAEGLASEGLAAEGPESPDEIFSRLIRR